MHSVIHYNTVYNVYRYWLPETTRGQLPTKQDVLQSLPWVSLTKAETDPINRSVLPICRYRLKPSFPHYSNRSQAMVDA